MIHFYIVYAYCLQHIMIYFLNICSIIHRNWFALYARNTKQSAWFYDKVPEGRGRGVYDFQIHRWNTSTLETQRSRWKVERQMCEWVSTLMKRAQYVTSASPSLSLYLIYIMVKNQCDIIATRIQLIYRAQCILISPRYIRSQSCSLGRIVNFLDTTRIPPKT